MSRVESVELPTICSNSAASSTAALELAGGAAAARADELEVSLLASLLGLMAQDIALFGMSPVAIDASVYALQGMVLVIAVLLLLLANRAAREGWLE